MTGIKEAKARSLWQASRPELRRLRDLRPQPGLDHKVLAGWNGLMISAFARAGRSLGEPRYTQAAERAMSFVLGTLRTEKGELRRRYCEGEVAFDAVLYDYAYVGRALIDLFEATGEARWLKEAKVLVGHMQRKFEDERGGFFDAATSKLGVRTKDGYDGAMPSGNSVAIDFLIRLADICGVEGYRLSAEKALKVFKAELEPRAAAYPKMLLTVDPAARGLREIVLVGTEDLDETKAMRRVVNRRYLPGTVLALLNDEQAKKVGEISPLIRGKTSKKGAPIAYVCRAGVCKLPSTSVEKLEKQLEE